MSKLTVTINCAECGVERQITKACKSLATRCKPCQKTFNRTKARNRYRALKGIPLDQPIKSIIPEKKPKAAAEEVVDISTTPVASEQQKRDEAISMLTGEKRVKQASTILDLIDDESTDDDW